MVFFFLSFLIVLSQTPIIETFIAVCAAGLDTDVIRMKFINELKTKLLYRKINSFWNDIMASFYSCVSWEAQRLFLVFTGHLLIFVSLDTMWCVVSVGWGGAGGRRPPVVESSPDDGGRGRASGVCTMWLMPLFPPVAATCQLDCFIGVKQTVVGTDGTTGSTQCSVRSDRSPNAYSPGRISG